MLDTTRIRALSEPAAVAAALWLHEWLGGRAAADDLLDHLARIAPDTPPGLHEGGDAQPVGTLLARLRASNVEYAWPVLPRPGRTVGWPSTVIGDPSPAVLLVGRCSTFDPQPLEERLLLRAGSGGWVVDDLGRGPAAGPGQAGTQAERGPGPDSVTVLTAEALGPRAGARHFAELIEAAAAELSRLGLDRPAAAQQEPRWTETLRGLPRAADGQLVALVQRAGLVLDALDQALLDDGAAVTAGEAHARSARLLRLRGELCDLISAVAVGTSLA